MDGRTVIMSGEIWVSLADREAKSKHDVNVLYLATAVVNCDTRTSDSIWDRSHFALELETRGALVFYAHGRDVPAGLGACICPSSTVLPHFLPFFFFLPPAPAPALASGTPPIFTSPLSSGLGVTARSGPPAGALRSSGASGSAAIDLPSLPRFPINRPTSAALLVSYCRHVPDAGSNVLSVKVVVASPGACACGCGDDGRSVSAGFSGCFAAYFVRFWTLDADGLRTVYLEVMRVCSCGQVESRAPGV
jgi:hypothetical protein